MPRNEKNFPCTFEGCFSVFKKQSHLIRHKLIHNDERPFPCDYEGCTATFRSDSHLKRHKLTHTKEKNFKCEFADCNVSCTTEWNLKRHIRRTHSGLFKCEKCDKEFKKNKLLQQHISMEHKHSTVACNFPGCSAIFALPSKLKQHMKMHNKGYICPVKGCSQKFQLWSECRQHAELCKNKEMNCRICGKTFTIMHNLRAHEKIHDEEREVYQCSYAGCGRFYTKQYNLKAHVQSFHQNIRPYVCPKRYCNKSFHFQHLLRRHLDMHAKNMSYDRELKNDGPPLKKRRKRARGLRAPIVSNLTGFIPELWEKMTPEEVRSYLCAHQDDPTDTDEVKEDSFTQKTCTPLSSSDICPDESELPDTQSEEYGERKLIVDYSPGETTVTAITTEPDHSEDDDNAFILEPLGSREEAEAILNNQRVSSSSRLCSIELSNLKRRLEDLKDERRKEELSSSSSISGSTLMDSCHMQSLTESESDTEMVQLHMQHCVS